MEAAANPDDNRNPIGAFHNGQGIGEDKYKKAFYLTPDAININRLVDGLYVSVNPGFTEATGYSESDIIGRTSVDLNIWADPDDRLRLVEGLMQHGSIRNLEAQFRTKSGDVRFGLMSAAVIQIENVAHIVSVTRDITDRKNLELEQKRSEERFRRLAEDMPAFVVTCLPDGTLTFANDAIANLVGMAKDKLIGLNFFEFLTPTDQKMVKSKLAALTPEQPVETHEQSYQAPGQTIAYHQWTNRAFFDTARRVVGVQSVGEDITAKKSAEEQLRIAAISLESQFGIVITDSRTTILKVNHAFSEITGFASAEVVGQTPRVLNSGRHDKGFYASMWRSIRLNGAWSGEIWNRRKHGEVYPEWLTISAVKDEGGQITHYVGTFQDITSHKQADDQIMELAFFDPLTHLPNRRLLMDRLNDALRKCKRHRRLGALIFIDLDNFKVINDTVGHHHGDKLLEQVANRLSNCVRECDTVARLGGDEFVVMLEDLVENAIDGALQAESVSGKIQIALRQPYEIEGVLHRCTPSIGITLFGGDPSEDINDPLKHADLAMYQAKLAGRDTVRFYDAGMQAQMSRRATLEAELRTALAENQFRLFYQLQVTETGQGYGAEALVRWDHPQRGLVLPAEFIAIAEETGMILQLGQWVLECACAQLARWAILPRMNHLRLSINVSARQFHHPNFSNQIRMALTRNGVNPNLLKLELTETLLLQDVERTIEKFKELHSVGINFSLDDFGTGYSSLSYLRRLPLDELKIDQSFVQDVPNDPNACVIVKSILALGESLGLRVLAEGVETQEQRDFLADNGCHLFQGFRFGRPMTLDDLITVVNASPEPDGSGAVVT